MNTFLLQKPERLQILIQDRVNNFNFTKKKYFNFQFHEKKNFFFKFSDDDIDDKPIFTIGDVFTTELEPMEVEELSTNEKSPIGTSDGSGIRNRFFG